MIEPVKISAGITQFAFHTQRLDLLVWWLVALSKLPSVFCRVLPSSPHEMGITSTIRCFCKFDVEDRHLRLAVFSDARLDCGSMYASDRWVLAQSIDGSYSH